MLIPKALIAFALATIVIGNLKAATYEKGKLLWECDFTDATEVGRRFGGPAQKNQTPQNGLLISGGKILTTDVPYAELAGKNIWIEAEIRLDNIAQPEKPYWGAKAMLLTESEKSPTRYYEPTLPRYGTHDWDSYSKILPIPQDAKKMTLCVGIQNSTGDYYIRKFSIYETKVVDEATATVKAVMPNTANIPRGDFKGAQYRGFMSGRDLSEEAFQQLATWNVNLIRYQMQSGQTDISTPEKYQQWIDAEMQKIDALLPLCQKYGIKICLDLHTGPVGSKRNAQASNLITDWESVVSQLEQTWTKLAEHYRGNQLIYGYDILNEPVLAAESSNDVHPWGRAAEKVVKTIRKIDPDTPIVVEASLDNWRHFSYIDAPHIIYSTHAYSPVDYTHQGVLKETPFHWEYPGVVQGKYWNKETLREDLKDVIAFQKEHNARIYIGEFSVISSAKGNDQYVKDLTELFEEYGWDWTYHAFREFPGWSIEYVYQDGRYVPSNDNPRKTVIVEALKKNTQNINK